VARHRLIVLALLLVAGCEVFFGIKESSSSSAGGGGGTTTTTTTTADAGNADGPFCASNPGHFLCADFDEGSLEAGWTHYDQSDGGGGALHVTTMLDTDASWSPPASLGVTATLGDVGSSCQSGRLITDFTNTATGVSADLRFSGCDASLTGSGALVFLNVDCNPENGNTFGLVKLGLHPGGYQIELTPLDSDGGGPGSVVTLPVTTPPAGVFTRVLIDVVFGDPGSVTLTFDGVPAVDAGSVNIACASPRQKALGIGMLACNQLADCTVHFDNVLVDLLDGAADH
jgi:hypothetical protein